MIRFRRVSAITCIILCVMHPLLALGAERAPIPKDLKTTHILSTRDNTKQPLRYFLPPDRGKKPIPLVVALHSWSADYTQAQHTLPECRKRGWAMVIPNFRGPNKNPSACASDLAVQDVLDSVEWMKKQTKIDPHRVYLHGASGGGHMTLFMATRAPKVFAAATSWVPVTDLAAWHGETKAANRRYWKHLEAVCGGPPGTSSGVDSEYHKRSPIHFLENARGVAIDLNTGIHDGYTGSIPVTHSLLAFNKLADVNGHSDKKLTVDQIQHMRQKRAVPEALAFKGKQEPPRLRKVLFRRKAGPVRITVFDGGHEGDPPTAFRWLEEQSKRSSQKR